MSRTIHFIYSVPRPSYLPFKIVNKIIEKSGIFAPLYRNGSDLFIPWRSPVRAPHSISYNLLHAFKKYGKVKFYSLYEDTICDLKDDDILIGVPTQDHSKIPWEKPDYSTVYIRTLQKYPDHKNLYVLIPYSNEPQYLLWANEIIEKYGKNLNLALLGGKIWFDDWNQSPWKNYNIKNRIRVDMGINPKDYPLVKKWFNPKGKRGYLYVGHTSWYKNTAQLEKIAELMPGFEFGHVGGGTIKGWKKIADFADLNEKFMTDIAKKYDFFVNVSRDAQVTTVLEQTCFGLVIACTPESGYLCPSFIPLSTDNTNYNVKTLKELQETEEAVLLATVQKSKEYIEKNHSWKQFSETITNFMNLKN